MTADTTPTFDITVNDAGRIIVDFDGRSHTPVEERVVTEAGLYEFTSHEIAPNYSQGNTTTVTFVPTIGPRHTRTLFTTIDTISPSLFDIQPYGIGHATLDHFDLTFSEPMDITTIVTGATVLSPTGGTVGITEVVDLGANAYRVGFPLQNLDGVYQLLVSPTMADLSGNLLDEDGDGVGGEIPEDGYNYSLPVHKLGDNLLQTSGSIEMGGSFGIPNQTGRWSGDRTYSVKPSSPMVAPQGEYVRRFAYTTPDAAAVAGSISSDLWYLIDLGPYQSDIAAGQAVLWASALFNRRYDYAEDDTQFELEVAVYSGEPDTFPDQLESGALVSTDSVLLSDSDQLTWEPITGWMVLPAGSQFAAVRVTRG